MRERRDASATRTEIKQPRSKGETYNLRGTHSAITNELKKENGSAVQTERERVTWGERAGERRETVRGSSRDMIYCK